MAGICREGIIYQVDGRRSEKIWKVNVVFTFRWCYVEAGFSRTGI
jgi:metal-sulfur cluster biosynthetic enzyme